MYSCVCDGAREGKKRSDEFIHYVCIYTAASDSVSGDADLKSTVTILEGQVLALAAVSTYLFISHAHHIL